MSPTWNCLDMCVMLAILGSQRCWCQISFVQIGRSWKFEEMHSNSHRNLSGDGCVSTTPNPRTLTTSAHVHFTRVAQGSRLEARDLSHQVSSGCLCLDKSVIFTSGTPCLTRSRLCSFAGSLLHIPPALQIRLPCCSPHMEMTTATIHDTKRHLAPPESDVDGEQIRNTLASPLYLHEGEASADRPRVYHSM